MKSFTEAELHTYIDGALSEGARAEIETWLASHPEDAERLRAYAEQNALLRSFYNPVLDEPVPAALLAVRPHAWRRYAAAAAIFASSSGDKPCRSCKGRCTQVCASMRGHTVK